MGKEIKVPVYTVRRTDIRMVKPKKKKKKWTARADTLTPTGHKESMVLEREFWDNVQKVRQLRQRNREIKRLLAGGKIVKEAYINKNIKLYVLRLEHSCWYVGMSRNPDKRFIKHQKGKGAQWTKKHAPLEIIEIRDTGLNNDAEVALLEDQLTIEYARRYGTNVVRGGGYCQTCPRWPEEALDRDLSWIA